MKLKRSTHAVLQTFFRHSNALTTGTKENFVLVVSKVLVFTLHNVVHVISVPLSATSAPLKGGPEYEVIRVNYTRYTLKLKLLNCKNMHTTLVERAPVIPSY